MSAQLTDRELLEFAAKAAGYVLGPEWDCYETGIWVNGTGRGDGFLWSPLIDDGQALRLAVEMRMTVDVHLWRDEVQVRAYDKLRGGMYHVDESGETVAATRRAVVRAAAEIGKAMP